ncbi:DUF4347 domain-containing protein [Plectonema cf. radiosum LEGE 06105]|uniref:DUF4347 domain-containing protein n=1 Tax=Plectonema cf. radiosum LEGE 06105 TaxID=945769 RepID=A0A8J7EWD0_9CYAN|nr:DUF4347 domain-containing protein [Plectonema radiosum]MBE9211296.1 DUF4347 domain-containing protein [Plectonema cf. radiosum LEGE 06105]
MYNEQKVSFNTVRTLVFIDDAVEDFQSLVQALLPCSQIILIRSNYHEVEQITQTLNKCNRLKSLHIISNGSPGCLYLGKSNFNLFNLKHYASQLKTWSVPNLLLYGCNVAAGNTGNEFIRRLHLLTGANIGASIWKVDDTAKGVCLQLNYFLGEINSNLTILPSTWQTNIKVLQD